MTGEHKMDPRLREDDGKRDPVGYRAPRRHFRGIRHSREGGNPSPTTCLKGEGTGWIPAFARMTGKSA
jgi:hypothetical protein